MKNLVLITVFYYFLSYSHYIQCFEYMDGNLLTSVISDCFPAMPEKLLVPSLTLLVM